MFLTAELQAAGTSVEQSLQDDVLLPFLAARSAEPFSSLLANCCVPAADSRDSHNSALTAEAASASSDITQVDDAASPIDQRTEAIALAFCDTLGRIDASSENGIQPDRAGSQAMEPASLNMPTKVASSGEPLIAREKTAGPILELEPLQSQPQQPGGISSPAIKEDGHGTAESNSDRLHQIRDAGSLAEDRLTIFSVMHASHVLETPEPSAGAAATNWHETRVEVTEFLLQQVAPRAEIMQPGTLQVWRVFQPGLGMIELSIDGSATQRGLELTISAEPSLHVLIREHLQELTESLARAGIELVSLNLRQQADTAHPDLEWLEAPVPEVAGGKEFRSISAVASTGIARYRLMSVIA